MEPRTLEYIRAACNGQLREGDGQALATGISTDSRKFSKGDVFFAIKGERFDGHDYVSQLVGANAVVVERTVTASCPVIEVKNVRRALGAFAGGYRKDFDLTVIAIGGADGQTTTQEMRASIPEQGIPTVRRVR